MIVLALDTACETCATAIMRGGLIMSAESTHLGKGHAEFLPAQIETVIKKAGISFADIDRIAVNVGPGSFTGIRIGVATARGFALALQAPAIAVNNLEALALEAANAFPGRPICVIQEAALDRFFVASFNQTGKEKIFFENMAPENIALEDIRKHLSPETVLTGSGAERIAAALSLKATIFVKSHADITAFALLGSQKPVLGSPSPLYLRAPDAKPQSGFTLAQKKEG